MDSATDGTSMNALSTRTEHDPHFRRLRRDEAEWRDRLNQLADMRRALLAAPGTSIMAAPDNGHDNATENP
jgi:hypothetical protein